jgi:hypothetical protein
MFQKQPFSLYTWEVWRDVIPPNTFSFVPLCEREALAQWHKSVIWGRRSRPQTPTER